MTDTGAPVKVVESMGLEQMDRDEVRVVFTPSGKRGRFAPGTTVLHAARTLGVDLDSVCGGRAICGRCQIRLSEGSFAKHGIESRVHHLSSATETEIKNTGPVPVSRQEPHIGVIIFFIYNHAVS